MIAAPRLAVVLEHGPGDDAGRTVPRRAIARVVADDEIGRVLEIGAALAIEASPAFRTVGILVPARLAIFGPVAEVPFGEGPDAFPSSSALMIRAVYRMTKDSAKACTSINSLMAAGVTAAGLPSAASTPSQDMIAARASA